ncbi:MAG: stage III sporulation protein AB [Clostridia bacterium]|nr:stage III sporulation protein AB [Clostridia bacterium]
MKYGELFRKTGEQIGVEFAGEAWENCVDKSNISLTNEDKEALKSLGKLLGKTDMQGQLKQLSLVNCFLDEQIKEATIEKEKNSTLYKKLGVIVGLAVVIVLV